MSRRLISTSRSEMSRMTARQLKQSIQASEGRVVLCQTYVDLPPLCEGTLNAELAQAFGADMIFLNGYSLDAAWEHKGLQAEVWDRGKFQTRQLRLQELKKWIDVPLGIYLECGDGDDLTTSTAPNHKLVRKDRVATKENLLKARQEGVDFIILGGNPGTGTSFSRIVEAARSAKQLLGDSVLIFAGKWEDGVTQKVLGDPTLAQGESEAFIKDLIDAGADVICLPMPGSRQAINVEDIRSLVTFAHTYKPGTLAMTFLDGSVEGADEATIRQCALWSKMTGADIHAIGDAGMSGVSIPEDIYAMSIALKGRRLTFRRLATHHR